MDTTDQKRRLALVVEDDPHSRDMLGGILQRLGFETLYAATVAEAMIKLAEEPQCLILDLMLSDGNGVEILARIREQELPIRTAVVTGVALPILTEVLKHRPDAVFRKPYSAMEIRDWVRAAA